MCIYVTQITLCIIHTQVTEQCYQKRNGSHDNHTQNIKTIHTIVTNKLLFCNCNEQNAIAIIINYQSIQKKGYINKVPLINKL